MPNDEIVVSPEAQEENKGFELKLSQLIVAVKAIDVAASRGAFAGEEMATVGLARNDIVEFLKASGFGQEAPEASDVEEETTEAE